MTMERSIAKIFRLNNETWQKHSNPWSVWTRYSVFPVLILAFWSRAWLGSWYLLAVLVAVAWMVINPVLFKKPASTKNWASKSVLGERVYLNRDVIAIPAHHLLVPKLTHLFSLVGTGFVIYSIVALSLLPAILGTLLTFAGKTWYLDRMVWLYEDMKHIDEYATWLY